MVGGLGVERSEVGPLRITCETSSRSEEEDGVDGRGGGWRRRRF